METLFIALFCGCLLGTVITGIALWKGIILGLVVLTIYVKVKGFSWASYLEMIKEGHKTGIGVVVIFLLIGIMTGMWRSSGTLAYVIYYASRLISPSAFLLTSCAVTGAMAMIIGSSTATAATIGIICMTLGNGFGVNPMLSGGAVMAGCFLGDRCSPVSSVELMNAQITGTNVFDNCRFLIKRSILPFGVTLGIYGILGIFVKGGTASSDVTKVIEEGFVLHWIELLPAAIIIVLSLLKVNSRINMGLSTLAAFIINLALQGHTILESIRYMVLGFTSDNPEVAALLGGGGIKSFLSVIIIVYVAACYGAIFKTTGMIDNLKAAVAKLAEKTTVFTANLITCTLISLIACTQTLAIILTLSLCEDLYEDKDVLAKEINISCGITPAVPWSLAAAAPVAACGAPMMCVLLGFYIYLLPLFECIRSLAARRKKA